MEKKFRFDEQKHRYYLNDVEMTGCTTVLGVLAKPALIGWAARMAVEYIEEHLDAKKALGDPSYLPKVFEDAKTAYAKFRDKRAGEGTNTHALVERYINYAIKENNGEPIRKVPTLEDNSSLFSLGETVLIGGFVAWAIENVGKFLGSEQKFYSESLFVAGTADFTFERKDGKRFLGDIKTYKKIWDNIPFVQCAGYALMAEEMGAEPYYGYCIVNLPPEGELECMWNMDIEGDKQAFKSAVNLYRFIKKL